MLKALKFRTGWVVATVRFALALALLGATGFDGAAALSGEARVRLVAGGYLAFAIVMLGIGLRSWWLAHRLRAAGFAVDAITAAAMLWLLASPGFALSGLFLASFVYVLLGIGLYWPGRAAALVGAGLCLAFVAVGAIRGDGGAMPVQLGPGVLIMIALMGFIAWVCARLGKERPVRLDLPPGGGLEAAFQAVTQFAGDHGEARGMAVSWATDDEPWVWVQTGGSLGTAHRRLGPEAFSDPAFGPGEALLFDRRRRRSLQLLGNGQVVARQGWAGHPLPDLCGAACGILVTLQARGGTGHLLLTDIAGISADHLRPARALALEIGHALDRRTIEVVARTADRTGLRDALARDLHDSVAQSLAGASFRIEALRQSLAAGRAIAADLDNLQLSLEREERHVQRLIANLRDDRDDPDRLSVLAEDLAAILEDTGARWGVAWTLDADPALPAMPLPVLHELGQILREAVANAVRHGGASRITVALRDAAGQTRLDIADDGTGFPVRPVALRPRSIADRVADLGGELTIASSGGRTVLRIVLPTGIRP